MTSYCFDIRSLSPISCVQISVIDDENMFDKESVMLDIDDELDVVMLIISAIIELGLTLTVPSSPFMR